MAYLVLNITVRSSKVLLIVSYMLRFVSLLHSHLIKWFQREYNLETVNLENELWFVKGGSWSQLCLFRWGRGRESKLCVPQFSHLQRDKVFLLIYSESVGNKHIMLRKFPMRVKCYGYLCMFTGLQSTRNTHLQRADRIWTEMTCWKKTNCRDVRQTGWQHTSKINTSRMFCKVLFVHSAFALLLHLSGAHLIISNCFSKASTIQLQINVSQLVQQLLWFKPVFLWVFNFQVTALGATQLL